MDAQLGRALYKFEDRAKNHRKGIKVASHNLYTKLTDLYNKLVQYLGG